METDNRLIAEFMEYIKESNEVYPLIYLIHEDWFATDELKFHNDWDWLMEVVEKIESLGYNTKVESLEHTRVTIQNGKYLTLIEIDNETKIEAVYNACLEFIKWYNEQK